MKIFAYRYQYQIINSIEDTVQLVGTAVILAENISEADALFAPYLSEIELPTLIKFEISSTTNEGFGPQILAITI